MSESAKQAFEYIRKQLPDFTPKHAILLGSGLGAFVEQMTDVTSIAYADIPGFHQTNVSGHSSMLVFGKICDEPIVCLAGRPHYYENPSDDSFLSLIRSVKLLGTENFISVSAVGSLRESVVPGEVVLVDDHINFHQRNPLIGPNDDEFGPRFIGMEDIYNPELRQRFQQIAEAENLAIHDGVYLSVMGPVFETPAEIRAYRLLGADIIGMSTVPEVIVAHHCGLKVAVLGAVTNLAAGMHTGNLSHDVTLQGAKLAAEKVKVLLNGFISISKDAE